MPSLFHPKILHYYDMFLVHVATAKVVYRLLNELTRHRIEGKGVEATI